MHRRDIIAISVLLGVLFLSTMVLLALFLWNRNYGKNNDVEEHITDYTGVDGARRSSDAALATTRSWKEKRASRRKSEIGQVVPSLATFIKAGDDGIYSSALFSGLHAVQRSEDISLDTIYDALADAMKIRPAAERLAYSRSMSQFLVSRKTGVGRCPTVAMGQEAKAEIPSRRKHRMSLEIVQSVRKPRKRKTLQAPILISMLDPLRSGERREMAAVSHTSWDVQHAQYFEERMGITVTAGELAALSIVLGCPSVSAPLQTSEKRHEAHLASAARGAFGISIQSIPASDGSHHISLKRHELQLSEQIPALSSGHSILFAKHMACGSLPFSQDANNTKSMLITPAAAEAIMAGTALQLQQDTELESASARFLLALPHSRQPDLYALTPTMQTPISGPVASPRLPDDLLNALARLPYATLSPLAPVPLISTTCFIASAGLPPGRLLQRLESLIEKVHRHSPHLFLFGPLYEPANAGPLIRDQERLGKLATSAHVEDTLAQKTARLHRYGILMERLMALSVEDGQLSKDEVQKRMVDAMVGELEKSYADAVAAEVVNQAGSVMDSLSQTQIQSQQQHAPPFLTPPPSTSASLPSPPPLAHPKPSMSSPTQPATATATATPLPISSARSFSPSKTPGPLPHQNRAPSSLSRNSESTRRSGAFASPNLGSQVENALKASLPLSVEEVAFVARMVLVAWCYSVGGVAWEEGEEGVGFEMVREGVGEGEGGMVMW